MSQIHDTTKLFCITEWKSAFYNVLIPGRTLRDNYNPFLERRVSFLSTKENSVSTVAILIISYPSFQNERQQNHTVLEHVRFFVLFACLLFLERWWSIENLQGIRLHCGQLEIFHYVQANISVYQFFKNSNTVPALSVSLLIYCVSVNGTLNFKVKNFQGNYNFLFVLPFSNFSADT